MKAFLNVLVKGKVVIKAFERELAARSAKQLYKAFYKRKNNKKGIVFWSDRFVRCARKKQKGEKKGIDRGEWRAARKCFEVVHV